MSYLRCTSDVCAVCMCDIIMNGNFKVGHHRGINIKTASSTDLAYRKSGSFLSKYVVCE